MAMTWNITYFDSFWNLDIPTSGSRHPHSEVDPDHPNPTPNETALEDGPERQEQVATNEEAHEGAQNIPPS